MYKYAYILSEVIFIAAWLAIFFYRKDTRKELLYVSFIFGLCAYLLEPLFVIDWWHPETITGTKLGLEDFMFCFFGGGSLSVLYQQVFKAGSKIPDQLISQNTVNGLASILIFFSLNYISFFIFNLHSFYSSVIGFSAAILFMWSKRADLIKPSIYIGMLSFPLGMFWFWWSEWISPGWVQHTWFLEKLSGIIILKAPVEDLIWASFTGAYISIIYKFWKGEKLSSI